MGEWCRHTPRPPNFVVPNVAFAERYAHLPQPQQNVAIIGGYTVRNMQNIAAIQTNANKMGEGMQTSLMSLNAFTQHHRDNS
jgi:hypothetical protein